MTSWTKTPPVCVRLVHSTLPQTVYNSGMNKTIVGAAAVLAVLLPAFAGAAYLGGGPNVLTAGADTASTNAYIAGASVDVAGPVGGDLYVAGANVLVTGSVSRDLTAAGATLNLVGPSAANVRAAGANVTLTSAVKGEVAIVGGQITVAQPSAIGQDAYLAGAAVNFLGNDAGDLTIAGGNVVIDGTVNGNLMITKATKVSFGPHALVKKNFTYSAPTAAVMDPGARVMGETVFHALPVPARSATAWGTLFGILTVWFLVKFVSLLLLAYLLWYGRPRDSRRVIELVKARFSRELLRGFALFVLVPVAAIIICFTVIGIAPAMIAMLIYVALLVIAAPYAFLFTGSLLWKGRTELRWYQVLAGGFVFMAVGIIPFVGWLVCGVVYLAALGGLAHTLGLRLGRDE